MAKFEVGKKYTGRFATDSNAKSCFEVLERTEKRIKIKNQETGEIKTVGVINLDGDEIAYPFGKYSMAPVIRGKRRE